MRFDLLSRGDVILPGKVLPGGALRSGAAGSPASSNPVSRLTRAILLKRSGRCGSRHMWTSVFTRPSPRWTGWKPSLTGRRAGALPFKTGCTKPTPALLGREGYRESVQREADQAVVAAQRPKLDYALAVAPLDSGRQGRVIDAVLAGHACKC